MSANVGLYFLPFVRIISLAHYLGIGLLTQKGTALQTSREIGIVSTFLLQHILMSKLAAVGMETQSSQFSFRLMNLRQREVTVAFHQAPTGGADAI